MASWTTIPDSALQPGAPVRSLDGIALRDNAIAIAEGASGAPRIANIALRHTLVGDVPLIFNTPIKTSVGFPYTKVKEILLAREGALRVKFDLRVEAAGGTAFGRIYVNGIAVGVERSNTSATFITYTEDIIEFKRRIST